MADQSIIDALFGGPSWLERANQERLKAQAAYLQGGPAAMMQDTSGIQGLAGGFGGTTKAATPELIAAAQAEYNMARARTSEIARHRAEGGKLFSDDDVTAARIAETDARNKLDALSPPEFAPVYRKPPPSYVPRGRKRTTGVY